MENIYVQGIADRLVTFAFALFAAFWLQDLHLHFSILL